MCRCPQKPFQKNHLIFFFKYDNIFLSLVGAAVKRGHSSTMVHFIILLQKRSFVKGIGKSRLFFGVFSTFYTKFLNAIEKETHGSVDIFFDLCISGPTVISMTRRAISDKIIIFCRQLLSGTSKNLPHGDFAMSFSVYFEGTHFNT